MRIPVIIAAGYLAIAAFRIALAEDPVPVADQQGIQGPWRLTGGERHGNAFSGEMMRHVAITFTGDKLSTRSGDHVEEVYFKLDPSTTPKNIDVNMHGAVGKGIYDLNGDGLKILHGNVGDPRPTSFDPEQSATSTYMLLERVSRPQK